MVCSRRPRWILATLIGLTVAGMMAGCSADLPTGSSASSSDGPLVEYQRQGGFAGWDDRLIIESESRATLEQRSGTQSLDLDSQLVDQLLEQLESIKFSTLEPEYLPQDTGADLIEYRVTYKGHTVHTMDTAVPDSLKPILELLDEIIQSGTSS